ncbi:hypothetical protein NQ317_011274 [Molorchus minor]|uniref:tRNA pseudouridine(55) synthase n=1 Tax=Molorchus minor TaxID=1323400 RepID=A0ABQ9JRJ3_9CUCU|nr:hypothetical protein NQ317_011274 [Molorchus minor]
MFKLILPTSEEKVAITKSLKELGCCARCILRYLGVRDLEMYLNPQECLYDFLEEVFKNDPKWQYQKKENICPTCLDIFEDSTLTTFVEGILSTNINDYVCPNFFTSVSFPKTVLIRSHSAFIYLKEKFPSIYNDENGLENLRKVLESHKINKIFSTTSTLNIIFEIQYEDDELEIQNIKSINHFFKKGKQKGASRNIIMDIIDECEDSLFKKHFSVPPSMPVKQTKAHILCVAEPLWIGGRYLKFSRDMGQTPWIINNKVMTEHCLQDILFNAIEKILQYNTSNLTFSASGREDSDVRMLGEGRPFYIQINNPKEMHIEFKKFREIENEILNTRIAAVIKLQQINKTDVMLIKDGEQHKHKHYKALCHIKQCEDIDILVNKINTDNSGPIEIQQKTPLRVLHRRTQAVRSKYIYNMKAKPVPGHSNLFEIMLITQAGTYVKEFINGDFQRTQPSLSSIIKHPVDVVALDVIKIDLKWPEGILPTNE